MPEMRGDRKQLYGSYSAHVVGASRSTPPFLQFPLVFHQASEKHGPLRFSLSLREAYHFPLPTPPREVWPDARSGTIERNNRRNTDAGYVLGQNKLSKGECGKQPRPGAVFTTNHGTCYFSHGSRSSSGQSRAPDAKGCWDDPGISVQKENGRNQTKYTQKARL